MSDTLERVENASLLDRVVRPVHTIVRKALRPGAVLDTLHGVWLGHPLHPALAQMSVGAFLSAGVVDALHDGDRAARVLIATGLTSAAPTAAAGLADWADMHEQQQRVGVAHAVMNSTGLALYAASLLARTSGRRGAGRALGYAGLGALSVGAFMGGHLAYRQAAGANHGEEVPHLVTPGWHDLCAVDDLPPDATPQQRTLGSVPLLLLRQGERISVLSDRCTHLSGPLHDGELIRDGSCVRCPWHGSEFRLEDGAVMRGPATARQHVFDVRVVAGRVEVRLPHAGRVPEAGPDG